MFTDVRDMKQKMFFRWTPFRIVTLLVLICTIGGVCFSACANEPTGTRWVGTWGTAVQLVETHNNPPEPGLSNHTIRQIVRVSIGGARLQMKFSNEFSSKPVTLKAVHLAVSTGGSSIDASTDKALSFNGEPEVTLKPGATIKSDPFQFALSPLSEVAVTLYLGETSPDITGHPGSRTTSYILPGNEVGNVNFAAAVTTDHWYIIHAIDVMAPDSSSALVILGNSITDGRGSGTNRQNRWTDELARRLQANIATQHVGVLNKGLGGNCVLGTCLGPSALSRFERDVINQSGIRWVLLFEGINDIGNSDEPGVGKKLIDAYRQMIEKAHAKGILVYGATLLPMRGNSYFSEAHEAEREMVNEWIRTSGAFDAVIDLDKAMRNPEDAQSLLPSADTGDHLHPNENGHHMLGEAVDLGLFLPSKTN